MKQQGSSVRRAIPTRYVVAGMVAASVLNAAAVLLSTIAAVIAGLLLGILQINMIGTLPARRTMFLILGTAINTGLGALLITGYCAVRGNAACVRNPIILSIIPGALLAIVWIPTLLNSLVVALAHRK